MYFNIMCILYTNRVGLEFDILLISTVRTYCDLTFTHASLSKDMGFFTNPKLLNTAITRARYRVFLVGDVRALCSVGECKMCWIYIIRYCFVNNSFFSRISYLEIMENIQGGRQIKDVGDSNKSNNDDILYRQTLPEDNDALEPLTNLSIKETFTLNPSLISSLNDSQTVMNEENLNEKSEQETDIEPKYPVNIGLSSIQDVEKLNSSSNWSLVQNKPSLAVTSKTPISLQSINQPVPKIIPIPKNEVTRDNAFAKSSEIPKKLDVSLPQSDQETFLISRISDSIRTTTTTATMEVGQLPPNIHNTSVQPSLHLMNNQIGYVQHQQTTTATLLGNQPIEKQRVDANTNVHQWLPSATQTYHLPVIPTANAFQPTGHYYHPMMGPAATVIYPNQPGYPNMFIFPNKMHPQHCQQQQQHQQQQQQAPMNWFMVQQQQQHQQQPIFIRPQYYPNQRNLNNHTNPVNDQPPMQQQLQQQWHPQQQQQQQQPPQQLIYIPSFSKSTLRYKIQFLYDYCIHVLESAKSSQSLKDYIKRSTINVFQDVDGSEELPYSFTKKIFHEIELKIEANYTLVHDELTEFSGFIPDSAAHVFSHRLDQIEKKLTSLKVSFSSGPKMEEESSEKKACLQFMLKLCCHEAEICRKLQKERDSHAIFLEVKVSFLESKLNELHQLFEKNNLLIQDNSGASKWRESTTNITRLITPLVGGDVNLEDEEVDLWLAKQKDDPHVKEYHTAYNRRMAQRLPSPTP